MLIYELRKGGFAAARAFEGCVPAHPNDGVSGANGMAWTTTSPLSVPGSEEMTR